jgi:hypothetical protein
LQQDVELIDGDNVFLLRLLLTHPPTLTHKMARIKRKGESGAAKNYITRNQALKKLQISLSDFRRLCILKGE